MQIFKVGLHCVIKKIHHLNVITYTINFAKCTSGQGYLIK